MTLAPADVVIVALAGFVGAFIGTVMAVGTVVLFAIRQLRPYLDSMQSGLGLAEELAPDGRDVGAGGDSAANTAKYGQPTPTEPARTGADMDVPEADHG